MNKEDLMKMTKDELVSYKGSVYKEKQNYITMTYMLAINFGTKDNSSYGHYTFKTENLELYADSHGNYETIKYKNILVASSHSNEKFIIPGIWEKELLEIFEEKNKILIERNEEKLRKEKEEFINKYLFIEGLENE